MFNIRFAEAKDAADFAMWATINPQIPKADIEAGMRANNPTAVYLVIEKDGKTVLYLPIYCLVQVAFLGFNPEASHRDKLDALPLMLQAVETFCKEHGIREIQAFSKDGYAMAKWAQKNGFKPEDRTAFIRRVGGQ